MTWKTAITVSAVVLIFGTAEAVYVLRSGTVSPIGNRSDISAPGAGLVSVERTDHDRVLLSSEVVTNKRPRGTFRVTNKAEAAVTLEFAGKSCGCTNITVNGKPANTGDQWTLDGDAALNIELDAAFSGKPGSRRQTAIFAIRGGGKRDAILLQWDVEVVADVEVVPNPVRVRLTPESDSDQGPVARTTVELFVRRRDNVRTTDAPRPTLENLPPGMTVDTSIFLGRNTRLDGIVEDQWQFELITEPFDQQRPHRSRARRAVARIASVGGATHEQPFDILFHLPSHIMHPASVVLGAVRVGESRCRRVLLLATEREPFEILEISSTNPVFTARVIRSQSAPRAWLEVAFRPTRSGTLNGTLHLTTNHRRSRSLTIACTARGIDAVDPTQNQNKGPFSLKPP